MIKIIVSLTIAYLTFALFSTLAPWYNETFKEKKEEKTDIELCGKDYPPYRGKDNVLLCECSTIEKQKPNRCGGK